MFFTHNAAAIAWALLIAVLCGLPGSEFENTRRVGADKVVHLVLFAILVLLFVVGLIKQHQFQSWRQHTVVKVFGLAVVYGILIECLQWLVFVGRTFEWWDAAFNAAGAALGAAVFYVIYGRRSYA